MVRANITPPDLCLELPATHEPHNWRILKSSSGLILRKCRRCQCEATRYQKEGFRNQHVFPLRCLSKKPRTERGSQFS